MVSNIYKFLSVVFIIFAASVFFPACSTGQPEYDSSTDSLRFAGEVHLRNIKQLTFGGNNAEAYWSFDDSKLVFQSDWDKINNQGCDQIFMMNSDGSNLPGGGRYQRISNGLGRTTCSYFLKDGRIIYASTFAADSACPETVMFKEGRYVWPIYESYDIYVYDPQTDSLNVLIDGPGYDAEATASPDGKYLVYTSTRSGDLELWRFDLKTGENIQLTDELGYDGGGFFSRDSKKIVWRASRPVGQAAADYRELLAQDLVEPTSLNVFVMDADGKNVKQVTDLPGANWAPFFYPSGDKILFCSNHHSLDQGGRLFDIFMINTDGTGLEQITHSGTFDAFPMFSYDGNKLVFASNRRVDRLESRATNIFTADWVEDPAQVDINFGTENTK